MHELIEGLIASGPVVTDGAWGTQLQARGLASGEHPDAWNLSQPDVVQQIPLPYVRAAQPRITRNEGKTLSWYY